MTIRPPAVAGQFYPEQPDELRQRVRQLLDQAPPPQITPKAIIAPHAGFIYSGPIAATAYRAVSKIADNITRVILLGPSHHVALRGIALPESTQFQTPLGNIPLDLAAIAKISTLSSVNVNAQAHTWEHSLEVQLPFLQLLLGEFQLVPLVVGEAQAEQTADLLNILWGGDETLIVVSSDLSHYHPYECANILDQATRHKIEMLSPELSGDQACGCQPINGLLVAAQQHGLKVTTLDIRNSGDTAGSHERVVGYGAYALH